MSKISLVPIESKVFGAIVTNVHLPSLTDEEFADVHKRFLHYGFLVFPGQFLSGAESIVFGKRFGELEYGALPVSNQEKHDDGSYGAIYELESQRMRDNLGNEFWHTDSSYWPISNKCAMLSAVTLPDEGGQTELADMRAGYAALDQATMDRIERLSAYHSTRYSNAQDLGDFPPQSEGTYHHGEAYLRPLVKTHPETGVKSLFIGRHAFGIPGLDRLESRALLQRLMDIAVSDERRVYRHEWQVGDTLLWDNRALAHRARPYDYSQARVLTATGVAGDPASELAYYPEDPLAQAGRDALADELEQLLHETSGKMFASATRAADCHNIQSHT